MKKIVTAILLTGVIVCCTTVFAGDAVTNNTSLEEIIAIHNQLAKLDKQLQHNRNNQDLAQEVARLERELVNRLQSYNEKVAALNSKKKEALKSMPAAGTPQK